MMIQGTLFGGEAATGCQASMILSDEGAYTLFYTEHGVQHAEDGQLQDLRITSRLANIPRMFDLMDGKQFEVTDNDRVDALLSRHGLQQKAGVIARLEDSPRVATGFVAGLAVLGLLFIQVVIPMLASRAADALPESVAFSISKNTMKMLDGRVFARSEIDPRSLRGLQEGLRSLLSHVPMDVKINLLFRKSDALGANAFALPSGHIVLTDALYDLADDDDELLAVIAHEIGHVVKRHGLRQMLEDSSVALLIFTMTSDVNGIVQAGATFPYLLLSSKYSRDFEIEADRYAIELLRDEGIDLVHYRNILMKLERQSQGKRVAGFLSSHPATEARIKLLGL